MRANLQRSDAKPIRQSRGREKAHPANEFFAGKNALPLNL
jgi:hypothetical protein